jgi:threonine dehydrogenase-like Zn-dependent dehydrogenase
MSESMRAWRIYDFNDMRLDEVPKPSVKPGWVVFRIKVVQPSISEVLSFRNTDSVGQETVRKIIEEQAPVQLFGHEMCAEVVEIGEGVTKFQVGDRVAARAVLPCLNCSLCRSGRFDKCRNGPMVGKTLPGCFAEYSTLPELGLIKLPDTVDDNEGALIQTLHACTEIIDIASLELGDTVVVLGVGCVGSFTLQLARVAGAGRIIAVDVRKEALELARALGADFIIDGGREDALQRVLQLSEYCGVDVVFECAGGRPEEGLAGTKTLHQALDMVHTGGKIVGASIIGDSEALDLVKYRTKGVSLLFPCNTSQKTADYAVDIAASGRIQLKPLITHVLQGLDKLPEAMEITVNKLKYGATSPAQVVVET